MARGFLAVAGLSLAAAAAVATGPIQFEEIAEKAGVHFASDSSPTANKNQPETMVAGVALFDFDNDGDLDIYSATPLDHPDI